MFSYEKALLFAQLLKGLMMVFDGKQHSEWSTGRLVSADVEIKDRGVVRFRWSPDSAFVTWQAIEENTVHTYHF